MRLFDILLALVALLFFAPLLLVIAAAVYVSDPGAILFAQRRIGYGGAYFRCFKFRSMAVNAEALLADLLASDPQARLEWELSHKLKEDPRVTRVGSFLRKSSLDELPQLFNVLRGEMSIVGPRPIVEAEKRRYGRYFEHYCRSTSTGSVPIAGSYGGCAARSASPAVLFATCTGWPCLLARSRSDPSR